MKHLLWILPACLTLWYANVIISSVLHATRVVVENGLNALK